MGFRRLSAAAAAAAAERGIHGQLLAKMGKSVNISKCI
jgi:hypothetical protein